MRNTANALLSTIIVRIVWDFALLMLHHQPVRPVYNYGNVILIVWSYGWSGHYHFWPTFIYCIVYRIWKLLINSQVHISSHSHRVGWIRWEYQYVETPKNSSANPLIAESAAFSRASLLKLLLFSLRTFQHDRFDAARSASGEMMTRMPRWSPYIQTQPF